MRRQVCGTVGNGCQENNTTFLQKGFFPHTKEIRKRDFSGLHDKKKCPIISIKSWW